jgi:hypothetical protein
MNVGDLKRLLEDVDDDAEVRFASQPSWPFEYSIADVHEHWPGGPSPYPDEEPGYDEFEDNPVVYLVEGRQLAYLPGDVARDIGW